MSGKLRIGALRSALAGMVERHESLRTVIEAVDGAGVQRIRDASESGVEMPVIDLSGLRKEDASKQCIDIAEQEGRMGFDLSRGPLLRAKVIKQSEVEHIVLFTMHHIICDAWSMAILVREIGELYHGYVTGQKKEFEPLPIQYVDYALWQREWLTGEVLEELLGYWKKQLGGVLPVMELPTDRPRGRVASHNGGRIGSKLRRELTGEIQKLSRREGVTLFMVMLAAFKLLLYRYTGQDDIIVGTPVAGHNRKETEGIIGFLVNTLVLRSDLTNNPGVKEALRRVKEVVLEAHAHQDLPFEMLVERLQPERSLNYSPLFQVIFNLQHDSRHAVELSSLQISTLASDANTAKFDLGLSIRERSGHICYSLEYSADLFDQPTIFRLASHFEVLLSRIIADPDCSISELSLLADAERQQLLVDWNDTERDFHSTKCVHHRFEEQVRRSPDAIAARCDDQQLTFNELNNRANQLSCRLREMGIALDANVGVYLNRSLELLVALLGILKGGAVYVPLDPEYPKERLAFVIEDSQMNAVLTTLDLLPDVPPSSAYAICLGEEGLNWAGIPVEDSPVVSAMDQLAYMIYTSGTTGKPKAVQVEHGNLSNVMLASEAKFDFSDKDVMLCIAGVSSDISLFEMLNPLLVGGAAVVLKRADILNADRLVQALAEATAIHAVPGLMRQVVNHILEKGEPADRFWNLRAVFTGGDFVSPDLLKQMQKVFPAAQIYVLYGPTEGTIICTSYAVPPGQEIQRSIIGAPLCNMTVNIFDQKQNPVPISVRGEIYIGGEGVTRGYLDRDGLTREKYVKIDGERYYRTGDLARYLPDGNIEFLGRSDEQVKIRGFRVELGEVECCLAQHPGVSECAIIASEFGQEDKRLIAYIVPDPNRAAKHGGFRRYLLERLPEWMVPSYYSIVKELPRNPNGKLDRLMLPAFEQPERLVEYARTETEEVVAGIWEQVLDVQAGVHDDFFELGGHSLLATQVASRLRKAFQIEIPLRALFEARTIGSLARRIEEYRSEAQGLLVPPIERAPRADQMPLSFAQQRLRFLDYLEPGNSLFNMRSAVRLRGELSVIALRQALSELVRRHESLRTRLPIVDGQPIQVIEPARPVYMLFADIGPASDEKIQRLAAEEGRRPFDLTQGPLIRVTLLRLSEFDHVMLFTTHHVISDGWSMSVLVSDLTALYESFINSEPSTLPEPQIQYVDFAHWQRGWLRDDALETRLAYWREQLRDAPALLALPTDRPRPGVRSYRGARHAFAFSSELTQSCRAFSTQEQVAMFMMTLAVFQATLHYYTGSDDIVVGTDVANRNRAETEGVIGFFVNQLVLRTDLSGDPTFQELLARVRKVTLGAYTHQDLPFDRLVEAINPERSLQHSPLFQVKIILQNAPRPPVGFAGLTMLPIVVDSGTAQLDLLVNLVVTERGLAGTWEYNTDLFNPATISTIAESFETVVGAVSARPGLRLSEIRKVLAEREAGRDSERAIQRKNVNLIKLKSVNRRSIGKTAGRLPEAVSGGNKSAPSI